ncbi:MAG: ROK family protein [Ktedonobacteraceae bacterium]|nr:ROK family protein [Ktedonobacteraceae bacterium]
MTTNTRAADKNTPAYIAVDIGGTNTRIGLFHALTSPEFTLLARFLTLPGYSEQMHAIVETVRNVEARAGIGVSIGGRIAKDGRSLIFGPNMLEYIGKPFAQDLIDQAGCPVRLAHDTVCGLLAEKKFGTIRQADRCAYLTLSTGTGAAFQLRKAATMLTVSIDIGHQILDGNPLACLCGQVGCLETFTGGRQLELRLGHAIASVNDSSFWETFCTKLALGMVNLAQLTKVEEVAVSGAIALNNPFLLPLLQQKINTMLVGSALHLSYAALGENAPLIGAAILLEAPEDTIVH